MPKLIDKPCSIQLIYYKCEQRKQNCYNYGKFGYLTRNYRNRRTEGKIRKGKRLKYRNGNNRQRIKKRNKNNSNLNEE